MASVQVDIDIDDEVVDQIVAHWDRGQWLGFVRDYRLEIERAFDSLPAERPEYDLSDPVTRLGVIVKLRRQGFKVEVGS